MADYGTRSDCTRDNRKTICPNSTGLGFSSNVAKRGNWITWEVDNHKHCGRVVGRVHCEGKTYIEVIATGVEFSAAHVRWINPADVRSCYPMPNLDVIAFMTGAWSDPDAILTRAARGFAFTSGQI